MRPAIRASLFGGALAASLAVAFLVFREGHLALAHGGLASLTFPVRLRDARPSAGGREPQATACDCSAGDRRGATCPRPRREHGPNAHARRRIHHRILLRDSRLRAHETFFGYIPEKWEWQGQFPKPYFFLQRVSLSLLGRSAVALRLSVQVYVAIISVMLFLTVREILGRASALIAVASTPFWP